MVPIYALLTYKNGTLCLPMQKAINKIQTDMNVINYGSLCDPYRVLVLITLHVVFIFCAHFMFYFKNYLGSYD